MHIIAGDLAVYVRSTPTATSQAAPFKRRRVLHLRHPLSRRAVSEATNGSLLWIKSSVCVPKIEDGSNKKVKAKARCSRPGSILR